MSKKSIAIIGSGWAGFTLSQKLSLAKYDVTVISPVRTIQYTPLLASAACGMFNFRLAEEPVRRRHRADLKYYKAKAEDIDFENRRIRCKATAITGDEEGHAFDVKFDQVCLAPGCDIQTFGTPGAKEHALFLRTTNDARLIQQRILEMLDKASLPNTSDAEQRDTLNIRIVGGGAIGIEAAAEIYDLWHEDMRFLYPHLDGKVTITIHDVAPQILSTFDSKLSEYATDSLKGKQIELKTSSHIQNVEADAIFTKEDGRLPYGLLLWATGNKASSLVEKLPVKKPEKGLPRMLTDKYLRVLRPDGSPMEGVFGLGDAADIDGESLPTLAEVALQKGEYLSNVLNQDSSASLKPFEYKQQALLAYLGRHDGIIGGREEWTGQSAWLAWRSGQVMDTQEGLVDDAAQGLLTRAEELLSELSTFATHFTQVADAVSGDGAHVTAGAVNYLRQQLKSEIQALSSIIDKQSGSSNELSTHRISSTNLPFFESLWAYAKQSRDIVALRKWVCNGLFEGKEVLAPGTHILHMPGDSIPSKNTTCLVDIIADGGRTWIKIAATTSKRLLWDMTKLGWAIGADDSDDEGDAGVTDDELEDIPLFKAAKGLAVSANAYRIRGKSPAVQLVLPRIASGESKDIDLVLNRIRSLGIQILCSHDLTNLSPVPLSKEILFQMAPNPLSGFSDILNVDTSVLIGLISDFSHRSVAKQEWFTAMQLGHLANEQKRRIAPTWIYPAMGSRQLICTPDAAKTCREIVRTIGTPSEIERLELLLCEDREMTRQQIIEKFEKLSDHNVPRDLQLPIQVVGDISGAPELPPEVWEALREVTEPTKSVFAFGWASGYTTLTSNGVGITSLTKNLEEIAYQGDWPSVWLCPFSRSLVGIPKHLRETE
ncbi:putative DUF1308 domain-containing protein [Seiridium cardinale]